MAGGQEIGTGQGTLGSVVEVALTGLELGVEQGVLATPWVSFAAIEDSDGALFELSAPQLAGGSGTLRGLYRREFRQAPVAVSVVAIEASDSAMFLIRPFRDTIAGRVNRRQRDEIALLLALGETMQ